MKKRFLCIYFVLMFILSSFGSIGVQAVLQDEHGAYILDPTVADDTSYDESVIAWVTDIRKRYDLAYVAKALVGAHHGSGDIEEDVLADFYDDFFFGWSNDGIPDISTWFRTSVTSFFNHLSITDKDKIRNWYLRLVNAGVEDGSQYYTLTPEDLEELGVSDIPVDYPSASYMVSYDELYEILKNPSTNRDFYFGSPDFPGFDENFLLIITSYLKSNANKNPDGTIKHIALHYRKIKYRNQQNEFDYEYLFWFSTLDSNRDLIRPDADMFPQGGIHGTLFWYNYGDKLYDMYLTGFPSRPKFAKFNDSGIPAVHQSFYTKNNDLLIEQSEDYILYPGFGLNGEPDIEIPNLPYPTWPYLPIDPTDPMDPTDPKDPSDNWWDDIWDFLGGLGDAIGNAIKGALDLVKFLGDLLSGLWNLLVRFVTELLKPLFDGIVNAITGLGKTITEAISNFLSGILEGIKNVFTELFIPKVNPFTSVSTKFNSKFKVVGQITEVSESLLYFDSGGSSAPPPLTFNYMGSEIPIIDLSFYETYRSYIHAIIIAVAYYRFVIKVIKMLPGIIGGVS